MKMWLFFLTSIKKHCQDYVVLNLLVSMFFDCFFSPARQIREGTTHAITNQIIVSTNKRRKFEEIGTTNKKSNSTQILRLDASLGLYGFSKGNIKYHSCELINDLFINLQSNN